MQKRGKNKQPEEGSDTLNQSLKRNGGSQGGKAAAHNKHTQAPIRPHLENNPDPHSHEADLNTRIKLVDK
jgi:hypothetical protein